MKKFELWHKLVLIVGIPVLLIVFLIFSSKMPSSPSGGKNGLDKPPEIKDSVRIANDPVLVKKSIDDVSKLVDIPDREKAKVAQIKNLEDLQKINTIFKRAYKNDYVIFLPTKTYIYDPSTKTIRDISNISFYDKL